MQISEITLAGIDPLLSVPPGLFDDDIRPDQSCDFLADPNNTLLLALDATRAAGKVTATILRHPDQAPSLFVNAVGTRDSHLRQGIATALMHRILAIARARGCKGIWLATEPANSAALALYRKLGGTAETFGWDGAF